MSNRRVSKEELEAFWRGDKDTYQRMYSNRMQQKANEAKRQGKQVTYVPNDGSGTLPEIIATAPKETEEQKQKRLKQDYENFTDNAITAAGFIPGLDIAVDIADISNSWRKGDKAGMIYGIVGLGLPVSGKVLKTVYTKLKSPLKTFYTELYPNFVKTRRNLNIPTLRNLKKDIQAFSRAGITENPFKAVSRNRLYRHRWNHPRLTVEDVTLDPQIIVNSQDDALELTKSRWFNGGAKQVDANMNGRMLASSTPKEEWDKLDISNYIPLKKTYHLLKEINDDNNFVNLLSSPIFHAVLNTRPGLNVTGTKTILMNDKLIDIYLPNTSKSITLSHEINHALNKGLKIPKGFSYRHLPKRAKDYLWDSGEIASRGTQLKNYFGFKTSDQVITPEMLKYAAKHYVNDTGMDNNMLQFFSGIKDWDAAADWLSKYSLKKGGKL